MKTLKKSKNKVFAGVCGGLADYFKIDAVIIRLIWVAVTLLWFLIPGILIYIAAAAIMPSVDEDSAVDYENLKSANVDIDETDKKTSETNKSAPHTDEDFNSYFDK